MSEIVVINDDDNVASVCVCLNHSVKSMELFSGHSIVLFGLQYWSFQECTTSNKYIIPKPTALISHNYLYKDSVQLSIITGLFYANLWNMADTSGSMSMYISMYDLKLAISKRCACVPAQGFLEHVCSLKSRLCSNMRPVPTKWDTSCKISFPSYWHIPVVQIISHYTSGLLPHLGSKTYCILKKFLCFLSISDMFSEPYLL